MSKNESWLFETTIIVGFLISLYLLILEITA